MIEPERHNVVGLSPRSGSVTHSEESRCAPQWKPLRLTISVQKIDLLLADIEKQVEDLLQQMMNLRLVRTQLADYQHEHWGDTGRVPYVHTHPALFDVRSDP